MSLKRIAVALTCMVVVGALAVGVVSGVLGAAAQTGLYASGLWSSNGPSTLPPGALDPTSRASASPEPKTTPSAGATSATEKLPVGVLVPAKSQGRVDRAALKALIKGVRVSDATGSYSGSVIEMGTGRVLFDHEADQPRIPASTMKLLTSTAALSILGPEHRFTTSVVAAESGQIILVGGGDPYLARKNVSGRTPERASIVDLARATQRVLIKRKVSNVKLGYDASVFSGPAWNPLWPTSYGDQVTPTSALWVNEGRLNGGSPGPRSGHPAEEAGKVFAAELGKRGIEVTSVGKARAKISAKPLASVSSMPLERIVEQLLMSSDNDAAEVVFRQAAIGAGGSGSIVAAQKAVRAELITLGIWDKGTTITDGSGLARETKVPADSMANLIRAAGSAKRPELRSVLTGLPVAGVEGSLRNRFLDNESRAGRGLVRAKTGTLREVHSRAGYVRTRDGSLLAFAFLINNAENEYNAVVWLDRVTAAISTCGCR